MSTDTPTVETEAVSTPAVADSPAPSITADDHDRAVFEAAEKAHGSQAEAEPESPESGTPEATEPAKPEAETTSQPDFADVLSRLDQMDLPPSRVNEFQADPIGSAMAALMRDGYPRKAVEAMAADDPKALVALGIKRMGVQVNMDRLYSQSRQQPKQGAEAKQGQPAAPVEPTGDDEAIKALSEQYGNELAQPLKSLFATRDQRFAQELQQRDQMVNFALSKLEQMEVQSVRQSLAAGEKPQYPQLNDDAAYQRVYKRYQVLAKTGEYTDVAEAFKDACAIVLRPTMADIQTKIADRSIKRQTSQPNLRGMSSKKPETPEEREYRIYEESAKKHGLSE